MDISFWLYLAVILGSFALSAVITPIIVGIAKRFNITDNPASLGRKVHQTPIPLLGGLAIFLSSVIVITAVRFFGLANFSGIPLSMFVAIILASSLIMIGGVLDDKLNLRPYQQIIFPLLAVVIVLVFGVHVGYVTNPLPFFGTIIYIPSILGVVIAGIWLLAMIYTTKFLDGLDGLATGIGAIASLFIFLISINWDIPGSATGIWALVLFGSCLGFLLYNWQPAKIFLGEGGSVFIGFMLGILSILTGSKITTTLLVMGLPFFDVFLVVIKRLMQGKSPFVGDRNHLHYQLMNLGLSKSQIVLLLYLLALAFGALGIISVSYIKMILLLFLVLVLVGLSWVSWVGGDRH